MEIHCAGGKLALEHRHDFTAFKVVVRDPGEPWEDVVQAFSGLARFDGTTTAWVSQAGLIQLAAGAAQPWLDGVAAMVAKARHYGWIDEATGDIKAHVVRA